MPLSVADVLALPVLQRGRPVVTAGEAGLGATVRWVHVAELPDIAGLLQGGELLLTTGVALTDIPSALRDFVADLVEAGAAGIVLELGRRFPQVPPAMAAEAQRLGLPVVALHRQVRFVEVTEAVHARIVAEQVERLQRSEQAHREFVRLSVGGATVEQVLARAHALAQTPVVLEDLGHRAVAYASEPGTEASLLEGWETRARTHREWLAVPVGPASRVWGRLVAPELRASASDADPSHPVPHEQAVMLLERAAEALTIARLVEHDRAGLLQQATRTLLADLLGGDEAAADPAALQARAEALGLSLPRRSHVVGLALRQDDPVRQKDPLRQEAADRELAAAASAVAREHRLRMLLAAVRPGLTLALLALPAGDTTASDQTLTTFVDGVRRRLPAVPHVVGVGPEASDASRWALSLREAAQVATVAAVAGIAAPAGGPRWYRNRDLRLHGLLLTLADDPRVVAFAEAELGRLLDHDARHGTWHVALLRRYLELGGNKALLARDVHLSRPALYARLDRIEAILGVPLEEPTSALALHVALIARDLAGAEA